MDAAINEPENERDEWSEQNAGFREVLRCLGQLTSSNLTEP